MEPSICLLFFSGSFIYRYRTASYTIPRIYGVWSFVSLTASHLIRTAYNTAYVERSGVAKMYTPPLRLHSDRGRLCIILAFTCCSHVLLYSLLICSYSYGFLPTLFAILHAVQDSHMTCQPITTPRFMSRWMVPGTHESYPGGWISLVSRLRLDGFLSVIVYIFYPEIPPLLRRHH
jgi:hypothetical protein